MILIRQKTSYHNNPPIDFSSVFSWSDRGRFDLNKFERLEWGGSDLNKIEEDVISDFIRKWLNESEVVLGLIPSTFWEQIDSTIGYGFFLSDPSDI